MDDLRALEKDFHTAVSEFAHQKEEALSKIEQENFKAKEKEEALRDLEASLADQQSSLSELKDFQELEQEELSQKQTEYQEAVDRQKKLEEKFEIEMTAIRVELDAGFEDLAAQKGVLEQDQERLVEEWDSLEQMNADFAKQTKAKETAFDDREATLSENERVLQDKEHRLNNLAQRLSEADKSMNAKQSFVSKKIRSIRLRNRKLNTGKTHLALSRQSLEYQKSKMIAKDAKIRKLAKTFISITED